MYISRKPAGSKTHFTAVGDGGYLGSYDGIGQGVPGFLSLECKNRIQDVLPQLTVFTWSIEYPEQLSYYLIELGGGCGALLLFLIKR